MCFDHQNHGQPAKHIEPFQTRNRRGKIVTAISHRAKLPERFFSASQERSGYFHARMDFLDELESRIIPADGAMGTELMAANIPAETCFEELCVSQPDLVCDIHDRYLAAGARLIETNTFGANAVRLARHGLEHRVNEINWSAAQLAKQC